MSEVDTASCGKETGQGPGLFHVPAPRPLLPLAGDFSYQELPPLPVNDLQLLTGFMQ